MLDDPRIAGLLRLGQGALKPAPGRARIFLALASGALCHADFALAVIAMMSAMFHGMQIGLGTVPWPWAAAVNLFLILQFPLVHSVLLTAAGRRFLARIVPGPHGAVLSTTTYATIASAQLLALFALWTPSGIIWWQAEGTAFWVLCATYGAAWLLLIKASFDAGAEVQSGALGWMSLMAKVRPVFPDMPDEGLFRLMRQPIYLAFALTLWTVPVWTPDQLVLATLLTGYCILAPLLKERRFAAAYGARFKAYRARVPYMLPRLAGPGNAVRAREATGLFEEERVAGKREAD
ncbi:MAG: isoprenylcysteine carboxylmethyltransferase family protein [Roseibium sp.]|uniref:methyltransferase family protein n=1 Tax=Roseibium sp. TaxID=1936156 RepID=UPI003D9C531D